MPDFPDQWSTRPRIPIQKTRLLFRRLPYWDITGGNTLRLYGIASTAAVGVPTLLGPNASGYVIGGPPRYTLFIDRVKVSS